MDAHRLQRLASRHRAAAYLAALLLGAAIAAHAAPPVDALPAHATTVYRVLTWLGAAAVVYLFLDALVLYAGGGSMNIAPPVGVGLGVWLAASCVRFAGDGIDQMVAFLMADPERSMAVAIGVAVLAVAVSAGTRLVAVPALDRPPFHDFDPMVAADLDPYPIPSAPPAKTHARPE